VIVSDPSLKENYMNEFVRQVTLKRAAERNQLKTFTEFNVGDMIKVFAKIKEGEKERVQMYQGVVIKIQGMGLGKSFTVRKISYGVGVERTFPYASPNLEKIEVLNHGRVRRSRLYFLRNLSGRSARLKSDLVLAEGDSAQEAAPAKEAAAKA
jgi:large subunit ribosomal protein L19